MLVIAKRYFVLLTAIIICSAITATTQEKLLPFTPCKTDTPPVIDGILDDPVWQIAPNETGFKTYHPDFGKEMAADTIVYYAYDAENLYFAYRCFDDEPEKIKAAIMARDNIRSDDWICVNIDSFYDQQSLYAIYVNPLGIQMDSRFQAGEEDFTFDMIWYSEGKIDEKGYTIELKIPFKSIRFSHKEPIEMGVIFERYISRFSQAGTYPALDPAQGANFLTQTRPLVLYDVKHYKLFELLPAFTYSNTSIADEGILKSDSDEKEVSLTTKYGITSHLIIDGTYNPDFSQIEADAGQVDFNLRYSLFYPEKRPFFLEGIEMFNFGANESSDPLGEIVHTRTIVNPLTGIKLLGKVGEKNAIATIYALDELLESESADYAHFSILRYKRSLQQDSFIGGFFTARELGSRSNRVLGSDGQFRINQPSLLSYHLFISQTKSSYEKQYDYGHAFGLQYFYSTRDWVVILGLHDISEDFHTETGYLSRTGLTRFKSGIMRMFYPQSNILLRIDPMIHSRQVRDKFSGLYETFNAFDLRLMLKKNSSIIAGARYATEIFLGEKFKTSALRAGASSQLTKQFFVSMSYFYQKKIRYVESPYQGYGHDANITLSYLPSEKIHFDLSAIYSDFYREPDSAKEYNYLIIRSRNTYQWSKYLFFRAIFEYNSFRKQFTTDFLASFTYIPGTVIHVGYGSLYEKIKWDLDHYIESDKFLETKRGFFFKASYLWRL